MNFIIHVNGVSADDAQAFQEQLQLFLTEQGCSFTCDLAGVDHTFVRGIPGMVPQEEPSLPPEEIPSEEIPSEEIPPEAAPLIPAMTETNECATCGKEVCECIEEEFSVDFCRAKTLTSSIQIPIKVNRAQKNTILSISSIATISESICFHFDTYVFTLPVAKTTDNVVNESHDFGETTIRLLLEFESKIIPCLVDIIEGKEEVLIIGEDLLKILQEDKENVPTK